MIKVTPILTTPTLISAAKPRYLALIRVFGDSGKTVRVAIDGSSDVSLDNGSKPGNVITGTTPMLLFNGHTDRLALSKDFYAIADQLGASAIVQED